MFRFFTGNAQVIHKRIEALQAQIDIWDQFVPQNAQAYKRLETQIEILRDELHDYKAALHKLRGQVHGPKGPEVVALNRERAPRTHSSAMTKDELRKRAGIVAGRPAPVAEEQPEYEDE
jgi:hypothetical protein